MLADDDGPLHLYFVRDHPENGRKSEICGTVLKDDLTGLADEPVTLLTQEQEWEKRSEGLLINEAPEMIRHSGKYYLSYSANGITSEDNRRDIHPQGIDL